MLYAKPVSDCEFRLNNPLKDIISVLRFPSISSPSLPHLFQVARRLNM